MSTRLREDDYSKDQIYEESTGTKPKQIVINLPEEKPPVTLGSPSPSGGGARSLGDGDIAVPVDDEIDWTAGLRKVANGWFDDDDGSFYTDEAIESFKRLGKIPSSSDYAGMLKQAATTTASTYAAGLGAGAALSAGVGVLGSSSAFNLLFGANAVPPVLDNLTSRRSGYYGYGGLGQYGLIGSALGSLIAGMNWDIGRNIVDRFFGRTQEPLSKYQESLIINDAQSKGIDTSGKTIDQILAELAKLPAVAQNESGLTDWQEYQREQDRFQNELALQRFDLEQARYYQQYERRPQYDPFMDEQAQQFNWLPDDAGFITPSVDGGLDGYGQTKQVDVWDGFNEINYGERENMSYRRYTPRRSYRRRGGVSVGRIYVFSRTPRAGFYPKQTRYGMRYVKRRRY